ncbi:MAG: phage tail protein [Bacteroidetes bacterium]|nr:MAG: phage tail protein [Bacteroidota bacterium]
MEGTIGQILFFAGNFAPRTWMLCNGQLLSIASNTALFSILGTQFGGDGRTTFGLPNFQSRVPVGAGAGPGLPTVVLGATYGSETHTLTTAQMPVHDHVVGSVTIPVSTGNATSDAPDGNVFAGTSDDQYAAAVAPDAQLAGTALTLGNTGGGQPINKVKPVLAVNFVICVQGVYPSRN